MNIELRKCISKHIEWCIKFATGVEMEIFAVCVITFEPIKIQTCSSPQNDRLNLSFVKDIKVIGKKPTRYGHKMDFCQSQRPFMSRKFDAPPSSSKIYLNKKLYVRLNQNMTVVRTEGVISRLSKIDPQLRLSAPKFQKNFFAYFSIF